MFRGKTDEGQEPPAPETSTPGVVDIGDTDRGHGPSGECFRSPPPGLTFMWISTFSAPEEDTTDTGNGEVEPSEPSRRTYQYRSSVGFFLTHTSCEKRLEGYCSRSRWNFFRCHNGGSRCVRSSQSHPGRHLRHLRELPSTSIVLHVEYTPDGLVYREQWPSGKRSKPSAHA